MHLPLCCSAHCFTVGIPISASPSRRLARMKRLVRPLVAAAVVLFAVQCQDRESPVAVDVFDRLEPSATQGEIEAMIAALFKTGHKTAATKRFQNAVRHLNKGNTSLAQKTILELIAWTLER